MVSIHSLAMKKLWYEKAAAKARCVVEMHAENFPSV